MDIALGSCELGTFRTSSTLLFCHTVITSGHPAEKRRRNGWSTLAGEGKGLVGCGLTDVVETEVVHCEWFQGILQGCQLLRSRRHERKGEEQ